MKGECKKDKCPFKHDKKKKGSTKDKTDEKGKKEKGKGKGKGKKGRPEKAAPAEEDGWFDDNDVDYEEYGELEGLEEE